MINDKSPSPNTLEMRRIAKAILRNNPYRAWYGSRVLLHKQCMEIAGVGHWGSFTTRTGRVYAFAERGARDTFVRQFNIKEQEDGKADQ